MSNNEKVINNVVIFFQKHINQFPKLGEFVLGDIIDFIRFMLVRLEKSGKVQDTSDEFVYLYSLGLLVNLNQIVEFIPGSGGRIGFYSWTETEGKLTCEYKYEIGAENKG